MQDYKLLFVYIGFLYGFSDDTTFHYVYIYACVLIML